MERKKLVLINPQNKRRKGFGINLESTYPPLGLGIIAALTPKMWDVVLIDENIEDYKYEDADLVGITSFTSSISRAYEIATDYRNKNIPVVIGGIHASMLPEEAEKYADAVVIGEAESVWGKVLDDFEKKKLNKRYYGELLPMENSPIARHDLFSDKYVFESIQTTRGCPMSCEFCTVTAFNGRAFRTRPVENVLDELEGIKSKSIMFVDDNIVGYNNKSRDHAKAIFRGIIDRGIEKDWICQASINFADDDELIELAAKSGCKMVLIGVESEKTDALINMKKRSNLKAGVDNYQKIFAKIQSFGISVLGTFIFGLSTDTLQDLKDRVEYIKHSNVDAHQISILTPFPGTVTYNEYLDEGRILKTNYPKDWELYDGGEVVVQPKKIKPDELESFKWEMADALFDYKTLMNKLRKSIKVTRNPKAAVWAFSANAHYNNIFFEGTPSKYIRVSDLLESLKGKN